MSTDPMQDQTEADFIYSIPYMQVGEKLGQGGFGQVWAGIYKPFTKIDNTNCNTYEQYDNIAKLNCLPENVFSNMNPAHPYNQQQQILLQQQANLNHHPNLDPTCNMGSYQSSSKSSMSDFQAQQLNLHNLDPNQANPGFGINPHHQAVPDNCQNPNLINHMIQHDVNDVNDSYNFVDHEMEYHENGYDHSNMDDIELHNQQINMMAMDDSDISDMASNKATYCGTANSFDTDNTLTNSTNTTNTPTPNMNPSLQNDCAEADMRNLNLQDGNLNFPLINNENNLQPEYHVAIKKIIFNTTNATTVHKRLTYIRRELALLKILHHMSHDDSHQSYQYYKKHSEIYKDLTIDLKKSYIIHNARTDYCTIYTITDRFHTDLRQSRRKILQTCSQPDIKYIMYKCLLGLEFIHHLGIVHRDISPDNIFINWANGSTRPVRIVISDLGQARFFIEYKGGRLPEKFARNQALRRKVSLTSPHLIGKIHFRPPEGLAYFTSDHYEQSWDVWQMGVVFLNIISKQRHPFAQVNKDFAMLTRSSKQQDQSLTNDGYMIGLIESHIGYPSEAEIKDLVFFYPKEEDHDDKVKNKTLSQMQHKQYNYKLTYYYELMAAFKTTFKAKQWGKTRHMSGMELDNYRLNFLLRGNRKKNYLFNDNHYECLRVIMMMIRFSPKNRPTTRQLISRYFPIVKSFFSDHQTGQPLPYIIPANELPPPQKIFWEHDVSFDSSKEFDDLKKFTSKYINHFGYLKIIKCTASLPQEIVIELFRIFWAMIDTYDREVYQNLEIVYKEMEKNYNMHIQRLFMKSLIHYDNGTVLNINNNQLENCMIFSTENLVIIVYEDHPGMSQKFN